MTSVEGLVSVVISTWTVDRWEDVIAAIESVRRQTTPAREIIVVVDHNPELLGRLASCSPGVIVAENCEGRGASGARNTGVKLASGTVVAFLDDDAIAAPDWLQRLSANFRDDVLGVGGAIAPAWATTRPAWFPREFDWVVGCNHPSMPPRPGPVRNLVAANMAVRRDLYLELGGLRDGIGPKGSTPLYCEETEFCIRASQRWPDRTWWYDPAARVQHRVTQARSSWRYFRSRCYAEGVSKSVIARLVGRGDGLASERRYMLTVLPRAIARNLADAAVHHDGAAITRAVAILVGLGITACGYVAGGTPWSSLRRHPGVAPVSAS
jgi:glycosyltransferase involved in cell wall biosynthesis